jgi:hypothetical protein
MVKVRNSKPVPACLSMIIHNSNNSAIASAAQIKIQCFSDLGRAGNTETPPGEAAAAPPPGTVSNSRSAIRAKPLQVRLDPSPVPVHRWNDSDPQNESRGSGIGLASERTKSPFVCQSLNPL